MVRKGLAVCPVDSRDFGGRVTRVCDGNGRATVLLSHEARAVRMARRVSDKAAYNQKRGYGQLRATPGEAVEAKMRLRCCRDAGGWRMKGGNRQRGRVCQDETPGRLNVGAGLPVCWHDPAFGCRQWGKYRDLFLGHTFRHAKGTDTWCLPRLFTRMICQLQGSAQFVPDSVHETLLITTRAIGTTSPPASRAAEMALLHHCRQGMLNKLCHDSQLVGHLAYGDSEQSSKCRLLRETTTTQIPRQLTTKCGRRIVSTQL